MAKEVVRPIDLPTTAGDYRSFVRMDLPLGSANTDPMVVAPLAIISGKLKAAWAVHHGKCVLLHGKDGKHSESSAHYKGKAVDLRIWTLSFGLHQVSSRHWWQSCVRFSRDLAGLLNSSPDATGHYYLVLEKHHIHLEYAAQNERPNIKSWKAGTFFYQTEDVKKLAA